ncbi:hypothetical protein BW45_06240 [Agrobacterium tumefaciens]|nr:hypothetical protein BW45_06240 [Agrobacterium tumefaciens]
MSSTACAGSSRSAPAAPNWRSRFRMQPLGICPARIASGSRSRGLARLSARSSRSSVPSSGRADRWRTSASPRPMATGRQPLRLVKARNRLETWHIP